MRDSLLCPVRGCGRGKEASHLVCRPCWLWLPKRAQHDIAENYEEGQTFATASTDYLRAAGSALHSLNNSRHGPPA